jgi:hypothetical protein
VLSENAAMLAIARHAGATFVCDGSETEGHLILPPANLNSHLSEMFDEQLAQFNYQIKVQAKQFRNTFSSLQSVLRDAAGAEKRE